ncbi:MAG: hypothetical protein WCE62_17490 [Polyangiales bacterium]
MGIAPDPKLVDLARTLFREVSGRPGVEGAAFIGALARNMYAAPRATEDVDIAVVLRDAAAYESVVEGLKRLGYCLKNETGEQGGEYPSLAQFDRSGGAREGGQHRLGPGAALRRRIRIRRTCSMGLGVGAANSPGAETMSVAGRPRRGL